MAGQDRGGHDGYSGTSLWKIKQQMAQVREAAQVEAMTVSQAVTVSSALSAEPPNVLVDAASMGGPRGQKAYVRHVLVKDLNKVATKSKLQFPRTHVFQNKASIGLYALFDGHSCGGNHGPNAAEFCAKTFHSKLMDNLSKLPPDQGSEVFVKAALIKSFEDLDLDLLHNQPDIEDGCGAAVCLLIGEHIFTALLGHCNAVLGEAKDNVLKSVALSGSQGQLWAAEERARLRRAGATVVGEGQQARLIHPTGAKSAVSRSLGNRSWKYTGSGGGALLSCTPEVQSVHIRSFEVHPFLLLTSSSVSQMIHPDAAVDTVKGYPMQPRAASGELVHNAMQLRGKSGKAAAGSDDTQFTAVKVCFLPPKQKEKVVAGPSATKRARTDGIDTQSRRLRHILVKYQDGKSVPGDGRPKATRSRLDAELLLRRALNELKHELEESKRTKGSPKDGNDIVMRQNKKFIELAKAISDCDSSKKGGAMCGDLGWIQADGMARFGGNFKENTEILKPGQWSDITMSEQGLHLIQRIA